LNLALLRAPEVKARSAQQMVFQADDCGCQARVTRKIVVILYFAGRMV
jgi:hypothetical protein